MLRVDTTRGALFLTRRGDTLYNPLDVPILTIAPCPGRGYEGSFPWNIPEGVGIKLQFEPHEKRDDLVAELEETERAITDACARKDNILERIAIVDEEEKLDHDFF